MIFSDVIDPVLHATPDWQAHGPTVVGIDIGSRTAKAVLLAGQDLHTVQVPTGVFMQETAEELLGELLESSGIARSEIDYVVGTGYGRIALQFADLPHRIVTEISCHALGAHSLHAATRTIIDIGGQDSKVIKVDTASGAVDEFIMNDKCAAGTGRFLEKVAGLLDLTIDELGPAAVRAVKELPISSQCVVFAESEVISYKARGESPEDIAAGIHLASARRVRTLVSRMKLEPDLVFSGGVSNNPGMHHALELLIGHPITRTRLDMIYAGALGAAVHARRHHAQQRSHSVGSTVGSEVADEAVSQVNGRIARRRQAFIARTAAHKQVGYLCNYTPLELLNASGAAHLRLFQAGDANTVATGEIITKSVFCDLTKSCLGAFQTGDPLSKSLDKVYTIYTCDSMKTVAEAINQFFIPTGIYTLPRYKDRESSRRFFRAEIRNYARDLEALTGRSISESDLAAEIRLYNQVRGLLRRISALRKRNRPPLTGGDFLEIVKAFWYLPPEELIALYGDLLARLEVVPDDQVPRVRLLMTGGIVADGDRRLLDLVEREIGARVVVEDHCAGLSPFLKDIDENEDPFVAIANGYLDQAPCARMAPLEDRLNASVALAGEYRVDAVLFTYLKFCPCYGLTKQRFLGRFQDQGLPVLELPSDYSQSDTGQLKTRVEAFLEVLSEHRSVRSA